MFAKGWGNGGGAWECRRMLWNWEEEMIGECRLLLVNVVLQDNIPDQWKWTLDTSGIYSVQSAYDMLTSDDNNLVNEVSDMIWHIHVPLKVSLLAWRLLRNRLPTKVNLMARGMLAQNANLRVAGCGEAETIHHLFVSCAIFSALWHQVRAWIGVSGADLIDVSNHFL